MNVDWSQLFGLSAPPAELIIRGSVMYLLLFLLFRVVIKRRVGAIGMADMLVLVIIADAAQNAMAGEYRSITDGAILIGTIFAWNYVVDWLNYRWQPLRKVLEPPPLLLIDRGRVLSRNLRVEFISRDELDSKLREHGVADPAEVDKAYLEPEGELSVLKRKKR